MTQLEVRKYTELQSDLISVDTVIKQNLFFNIPIYQRLYVWGREQIHTLLSDIWQAYKEGKDVFYLGGTLVIEREGPLGTAQSKRYDLIDGQQRFTTLWLISIAWQEHLGEYCQQETDTSPLHRISFSIRPEVTEFFNGVLSGNQERLPQARQLEDALEEIRNFATNFADRNHKEKIDISKLTYFIRHNVKVILTCVPDNTDLNKLFEVINNRGVQLQHHEILKARLLAKVDATEREGYSQLWDACAHMGDYVERNLRSATKLDTVSLFQDNESLADSKKVVTRLHAVNTASEDVAIPLKEILFGHLQIEGKELPNESNEVEDSAEQPDRVRSIISFSMLLQHTLRIFLIRPEYEAFRSPASADIKKVSDKDLLSIFGDAWLDDRVDAAPIKAFIECLWGVRYQFDKHVIKWVIREESEVHSIRRPYVNKRYLQRHTHDAAPNFALLQSMLYHSQQMTTQYWLTPLLSYLLQFKEANAEPYLQHLDNHFLSSRNEFSLLERSRQFVLEPWHHEELIDAAEALSQQFTNGTQYPHYWFYKLEYALYLHLEQDTKRNKWLKNYRMTAKNSVEHVAPQTPEYERDRVAPEKLHIFGNLALVTRSINSEMSNKSFGQKREDFIAHHKGQGVSLKLEYIYENTSWDEDSIQSHQNQMIDILATYMERTSSNTTRA